MELKSSDGTVCSLSLHVTNFVMSSIFKHWGSFFEAYGQILTEKGTLAGKRTDGKLTSKCLVMIVNFEA